VSIGFWLARRGKKHSDPFETSPGQRLQTLARGVPAVALAAVVQTPEAELAAHVLEDRRVGCALVVGVVDGCARWLARSWPVRVGETVRRIG
jgi:hypothetical protein